MRHATGWLVLGIVGCAAAAACSSTTGDSPSGAPVGDVAPTPRSDAATVTPGTPTPDGGIVTVDAASNDSAVAADTYVPVPDAALPDGAPDYDTDLAAAITNAKLTGNPANGIVAPPATMVALGRALFFDRILSASGDIACGTCHHPTLGGSDGARLSRGVGGTGFGPTREAGNGMLISRRAPSVWNAALLPNQFWDGRVRMIDPADASKGFQCPSQEIRKDVASIIAEQAEFPVVTGQEMRGDNFNGQPEQVVRDAAAGRVAGVAGYAPMFTSAFGDSAVTYSRVATAIGAYETSLLPLDTPWFRYVKTHAPAALSDDAKRGALLFYGKAGCSSCHSGDLLTDMGFHAIAIPQFGYGKGDSADGRDDFGRGRDSQQAADNYKFRTPSLVNVALRAPYGHDGAYQDLADVVRHHLDVQTATTHYAQSPDKGRLSPFLVTTLRSSAPMLAVLDPLLATPKALTPAELTELLAFLSAQSAYDAGALATDIPTSVPSGMPVDR